MRLLIFTCLLGWVLGTNLQAQTADEILETVRQSMTKATSYKANLKLNVTVPFLKAPPSTATLWFKAPDKTHIESPGFAMIPKQGADLSAARLLSRPYTAVDAGRGMFHGTVMRKIKVIPLEERADIVVATIWIDTTLMVPRKVVSTSKTGGTFTAELVYDNARAREFCLPSYVKLVFDIGSFELPKTMTGDFGSDDANEKADKSKAIVEIWYKNYEINLKIDDSLFKD